ncbi:tyrosine-type recombinase/integrase [Roseovarius sp. S4756]|uniref:tyrosine-type recombinase/integrase n=1 Tax=Roseovarius maritimus TaxID=3342637 RepID=UPI00372B029E
MIEATFGTPNANPVLSFSKRHVKERERVQWLRPKEYDWILESCTNQTQRALIQTAVHTGMRRGELVTLRKTMIDFDRKEVTLHVDLTKSKHGRVIFLCDTRRQALEELCSETPRDLVFKPYGPCERQVKGLHQFQQILGRYPERAELDDVRFQYLRHTFTFC